MTGQIISHYEVLEKLGTGGMGEVYKARDTRLNRIAALKVLAPDKMADADRRARFIQEAQAASALNHPHIVTIYGIDRDSGVDFIAMEYLQGRTLEQAIGRRGLKLADTLRFGIQIADALAAAHAAGIVHRDLKPGNVMVTESGSVKVLDFGLAKLTETPESSVDQATRTIRADAPATEKGTILGTVSYMSPEQAEGKPVDARSDIFSFGSLLYEMVTGKRAFVGSTKMSTISSILRDEPKPATEVTGEPMPRDLEKIIARCLRKDVARRFQHIDDVKVALEELKEESDSGKLIAADITSRRARSFVVPVMLGIVLAFAIAVLLWIRLRPAASIAAHDLKLRQLTQDGGLTYQPSISPDGKLIAYASDRAGDAGLDIWVQQLSQGAQPIRLTKDSADDYAPSFSPDAGQIVFTSEREGGGIYVIPSLGGEERLLMRGRLLGPRFSPDGQWVAASGMGAITSKLFIVPAAGGTPRQIGGSLYGASFRAWSPDGKKILAIGSTRVGEELDWWILPVDDGPPIQTGAANLLKKSHPGHRVSDWLGEYILFSDRNLWRIKLSPSTGKVTEEPERLTSGTDYEGSARAIPAGSDPNGKWRIVFGSTQGSENLWSMPIDWNVAKPLGAPAKLIRDAVNRNSPSLATDGGRLVYISELLGQFSLRSRDMTTGAEKILLQQSTDLRARISPDGSTIAYNLSSAREGEITIYLAPASGGESRKLCDNCGLLYNWTPDGKSLTFRSGSPMKFSVVDIASGQQRVLISNPKYHIHGVEYSPDGRWLAFHFAPVLGSPRAIYLVPLRDSQAAPEGEWIAIMDRPGAHTRPWWSPDGNVIYFLSTAGGKLEIWAQRLQPATKRPIREPFRIYSPFGERYSIRTGTWFGPGIGPRSVIFPVDESTGNIWLAE